MSHIPVNPGFAERVRATHNNIKPKLRAESSINEGLIDAAVESSGPGMMEGIAKAAKLNWVIIALVVVIILLIIGVVFLVYKLEKMKKTDKENRENAEFLARRRVHFPPNPATFIDRAEHVEPAIRRANIQPISEPTPTSGPALNPEIEMKEPRFVDRHGDEIKPCNDVIKEPPSLEQLMEYVKPKEQQSEIDDIVAGAEPEQEEQENDVETVISEPEPEPEPEQVTKTVKRLKKKRQT